MNLYQFFIIVAFYLHRVLPTAGAKTSVIVYKDDKCKAPAQYVSITSSLTCTPQANHYDPVCVKGAAGYTVSDCINYNRGGWDDVGVVRDTLEGVSYLGVEKYMAGREARMYRLDENCYSNAEGTASHRLTLDRSATITTYSDATCTNVKSTSMIRMEVIGVSQAWASMDDMTAFFGGVPPNFTVVGVYDDSTCSNAPTQITFSQGFNFTDYSAALFGAKSPYLIVEEYSNPWCRLAENVTTYSADGSCHTNAGGTTSFRASINVADSTATITMYSDSECTFVTSDTNLDGQALSSSPCMLYQCKKTAVVAYEDSSCLSTATSVTLKSSLTCTPQANHYDPVCVKGAAGYTVSDCINYNRGGWMTSGRPRHLEGVSYLGVEKYMAGRGGQGDYMTSAKMYRLDENCYSNAEGTASHRLTLDRSATITTYSDATCTNVKSTSMIRMEVIGVSQAWASMDDMTAFFGGVPPNFTVVGVYDDSTCSNAPTQITFSQGFNDGGSHFAIPGCVSSFTDYSAALFGAKSPYLIVGGNVTTYSADGSCHTNAGGTTSFRASINVADSTATITMYSDSECTFVTSDTNLDGQALSSSPVYAISM
ncbi:hypothetical protein GQ600_25960 [Phytophthora cactorum]|nr:hypothetical protein GQ600_25960 [Phytophthora cactorum]